MNELELTGQTRSHIVQMESPRFAVHPAVVKPFFAMCEAAKNEGIKIAPFSSYRDFKTQVKIWNKKFSGKKTLYDQQGKPLDYSSLTESEIIDVILGWSALPGASRHHWGTEIDVVDANVTKDYIVQLLPHEVTTGGIFHKLHNWLDHNMKRFGFFRPYDIYRGGMYAEPWHLSYAPISSSLLSGLTLDVVKNAIEKSSILGKEMVLKRLPEIYQNHIANITKIEMQ